MTLGSLVYPRAHHLRWSDIAAARYSLGAGFVVIALLIFNLLLVPAAYGSSLSERFPSSDNFPQGTLVSIGTDSPQSVGLADINNTDFLVGVVENEGNSLLSISREVGDLTVALSGEVEVFVSDVNGPIKQGDFVGTSWIRGVGMKSLENTEQKLLGIALESFDENSTDSVAFDDIETPTGTQEAKIGKIALRLFDRQIGTEFASNDDSTSVLERFAARIAGRDVLFARVIASAVLFIVSAVISGVFLANAIRGSFISLGRNPLASSSIYSNLIQVSGVSIGVILIGTVLAYIILII